MIQKKVKHVNCYFYCLYSTRHFPGGSVVENLPFNAGDAGRPSGGGNGYPLQYSCLENPMDRGAWRATVHSVAKRVRHD